jgi:hypothetical protein
LGYHLIENAGCLPQFRHLLEKLIEVHPFSSLQVLELIWKSWLDEISDGATTAQLCTLSHSWRLRRHILSETAFIVSPDASSVSFWISSIVIFEDHLIQCAHVFCLFIRCLVNT